MQLIEMLGDGGKFKATLGEAIIMGAHTEWVEITSIAVVGGERPPMAAPPIHFFSFGTGEFSADTNICLYHLDQGPFPTRLIVPARQNGSLSLRQTGSELVRDWSLEFEFEWRTRAAPVRWMR